MLLLPPLDSLRFFEAAARHQGYVAAAEELGVSPALIAARGRPGGPADVGRWPLLYDLGWDADWSYWFARQGEPRAVGVSPAGSRIRSGGAASPTSAIRRGFQLISGVFRPRPRSVRQQERRRGPKRDQGPSR